MISHNILISYAPMLTSTSCVALATMIADFFLQFDAPLVEGDTNTEKKKLKVRRDIEQQGSKNLFCNTRQGGSKRKVLFAKVAVKLKFQSPN